MGIAVRDQDVSTSLLQLKGDRAAIRSQTVAQALRSLLDTLDAH
jgi:nicotinamide mononucleotide (NMN) deamidase PncC